MSRSHRPGSGRLRSAWRGSAIAATLALIAATALLGAGPAAAIAPKTAPTTEPSVPVMIVLDASGSMNQADAPGPRIDAAKAAVSNLVNALPAQTQVGLQVYGTGTGSTDAEKTVGCTDIDTLVPVGPLDSGAIKTQLGGVAASGYTPIGNALRAAADALPNEGPRSIVLVSDGEDTCAPPAPCDVARELKGQGIDLVVHTVGFKVDATAREQLSCIATATGGTYSDADDAAQLNTALETKVDYAVTGYSLQGTAVTGAELPSREAPLLAPGQYTDTLANASASVTDFSGSTKYYTVPIRPGVRVYVSVTMIPPDASATSIVGWGTDVDLLAEDLQSCSSGDGRNVEIVSSDKQSPVTTVISQDIGGTRYPKNCPQEGVLILRVERLGTGYQGLATPIEIAVRSEPGADASAVPPPADQGAELARPSHGAATPITGGDSFNNAPEIASGATYSDTVVTGDGRYFRVPLEWGQRFSYLITPLGDPQPELQPGSVVSVEVFNPVRHSVDTTNVITDFQFWFNSGTAEPFTATTRYPARYTNRSVADSKDYSLDGDYYLRLSTNLSDPPSAEGYLLTVVVSGDVEPGPIYQVGEVAATTSSSAGAASVGASSSSTATAGATSDATTAATAPASGTVGSASEESQFTGRTWIYLALGLVVVAAALTLVFVLRRRRSTNVLPPHS